MRITVKQVCGLLLLLPLVSNAASFDEAMQLKNNQQLEASEAAFKSVLADNPSDTRALEQLAVVQSWQNKFDAAVASFRHLLVLDPQYPNAHVGLARVLYWQGQRQEALSQLAIALNAQPSADDIWILQGDVLLADNQPDAARESYLKAKALQGGNADPALEKKISAAKPARHWRLDAGYVADHFSEVRDNEHSAYLQLGYTTTNKTTLYAKWEDYFNFDETDRGAGLGVYWLPMDSILINAEWARTTDDADFRPDSIALLNTEFLFSAQLQPLLGYRRSHYDSAFSQGDVTTIMPGLRWNFASASIELRHGRTTNLDDSTTSVDTGKLTFNGEKYSPYLSYTTGKEATPPLEVADISVISAGLVMRLSDGWGARIDYAREDRKDSYIHTAIGVGVSAFF
ncbi:YaiO family outer membrane beta-barrel protein [Permianibacter sp. IMCC34836]|uniref:YaiO family outer membrane beta-barrel protein n=1 Tax=Permianibacter fluminis TaxID=2738515 RepID=UPI00155508AA|nr:YaiO family outer membrane beta-barrel protein [Permianibacter fluminis]NQD35972.1 YaiO family outer membrane beta-barrel protein [Permianibacter fluminis]